MGLCNSFLDCLPLYFIVYIMLNLRIIIGALTLVLGILLMVKNRNYSKTLSYLPIAFGLILILWQVLQH